MGEDGSGEHDPAPVWRNPAWIGAIAGLIGSVGTIAALWMGNSSPDSEATIASDDAQTTEQTTTTTPQGTSSTTTMVEGYWTTDGSKPPLSQDCFGVVGACLDDPIETISEALGTPDTRYPVVGAGQLTTIWGLGPGGVSFTTDSVDVIIEASVRGGADFRMALPQGWILGEFSLNDMIDSTGQPFDIDVFGGEGTTVVTVAYCDGPEGSYTEEYSLDVGWEEEIATSLDEGNAIGLVGDRPVSSYSVRSRGVEGLTENC